MIKLRYIILLGLWTWVALAPSASLSSERSSQQQLYAIIAKDLTIQDIARNIWEDLIGGDILKEIHEFKNLHKTPFSEFQNGATWISLKKELDTNMTKPMRGADYSWDEFRNIDLKFKEQIVNKALLRFDLKPVKWQATGTVGYNSDIDNVALGENPTQEITAKLLFDTLNIYMYGTSSDETFDEQSYTEHPGANLQTMSNLEAPEAHEKYEKIAFSLSQLQIYRNLKHSHTLPWNEYKKELIKIFPEGRDVLNSVAQYDQDLEIATRTDQETLKKKLSPSKTPSAHDLSALIDLKAITTLMQQINAQMNKENELGQSLKKVKEQPEDQDLKRIIDAAIKEKDDLAIQTALLFALCETYFPEGYYTQEAFQLVVMGDQPISQVLSNMVNDYMKKGNPDGFKSIEELRAHLVETHRDLLFKTTPFVSLMSLGEQLGYMVHKIESRTIQDQRTFLKGAKYLYRFAFSLQQLSSYLDQNKQTLDQILKSPYTDVYPVLRSEFVQRLLHIAEALSAFQRGKIYISQKRLEEDLKKFIQKAAPSINPQDQTKIVKQTADYLWQKTNIEVLTPSERIQAIAHIFAQQNKLKKALNIMITDEGVLTSDPDMTVLLNALLGKSRADNTIIREHFDKELSRAYLDLDLNDPEEIEILFNQIVKAYVVSVKLFFLLPENRFNPYSLNYNEIHLGHTYDPDSLIPEK